MKRRYRYIYIYIYIYIFYRLKVSQVVYAFIDM